MTNKELLELAAKAAQYSYDGTVLKNAVTDFEYDGWNPLDDDGDALRLAVKLNMGISIPVMAATHARVDVITFRNSGVNVMESCNNDPYAATRRAIVRAAAEIGRSMK